VVNGHSADLRAGAETEARCEGRTSSVLDVREPHEHKIANLGAPLIPVGDIERRASELAEQEEQRKSSSTAKAGVRSQKAALALKQAGFTNVSNLTGGILAWGRKRSIRRWPRP